MRVIILGAGPAGLSAAREVLRAGHVPVVVDPGAPGGHAVHNSLIPSKIWIEAAHQVASGRGTVGDNLARLRQRADAIAASALAALPAAAVVRASGRPVLADGRPGVHLSDGREIFGDRLIVAVGSVQRSVSGLPPDGRRVLIPRHLAALSEPPSTITVVGAGPTGLEVAVLFRRLGARVTLLTPDDRLLPGWHPALAERLARWIADLGIELRTHTWIVSGSVEPDGTVCLRDATGRVHRAPQVFLATGRVPVAFDPWPAFLPRNPEGFVAADTLGRTAHPQVFAAGDCTGPPLLAGRARHQGRAAARLAIGDAPPAPSPVVEVIYTHPDVGRVVSDAADRAGCWIAKPGPLAFRMALEEEVPVEPYLAVYTDRDDRVVGAEGIGPGLGDVLAVVQAAAVGHLPVDRLATLPFPTPTVAEWLEDLEPGP
jgi:dihydrolipoamide dehydrogenase